MTTSTAREVPFRVGARRFDARDLHVAIERLAAEADREDRNGPGLEGGNRLVERLVRGVGAVGDQHQAGERQAGQLVARPLERGGEARRRAGILEVRDVVQPIGAGGEAEMAQDEPVGQRLVQRPLVGRALSGRSRSGAGRRGRRSSCCASRRR